MRLMLKHKILGMACIAALLPAAVMLLLAGMQRSRISSTVRDDLNTLIHANIKQLALDAYHTCEATNEFIRHQVGYNLKVAEKVLKDAGPLRLSPDKSALHVVNQYTGSAASVSLSRMTLGGKWIGHNTRVSVTTPVVDETQSLVGGVCTIFQKMNEPGDMLRVATNVRTTEDTRDVDTYLPAVHSDGSPDPVISVVLRGETFVGGAYVVNDWYICAYKPMLDSDDNLVGMLGVGIPVGRVSSLREAIMGVKVGQSGYVFVMGSKDKNKARLLIPLEGYREGDNLWETKDLEGKLFIQSMVSKALTLKQDEVRFERFLWKQKADNAPAMVTAAFAYYDPWDWIIVAAAYEGEFHGARDKLESSLSGLFRWSVVSVIAATGIALVIAFSLTGKITAPIGKITAVAQQIALGDLKTATQSAISAGASGSGASPVPGTGDATLRNQDETGQLLQAIRTMTQSLNSLVGQVKHSSIQLVSTSTEIAAAAKQQAATVNDFGASTNEVVTATQEISATAQELLNTMNDATQMASTTASLAGSGRSGLADMEANMRQLVDATRSISHKLAVISDKANNINSVVTAITKVADETNLLSLNAAIEAEKAGESGLGFSVVAREIRRLADQTAVATLDIEQMVKEMRTAVSAGVMEMDKYTEEVRRNVSEVGRISEQLEIIIGHVQALTPRFESVNRGMHMQAQGAQQISKAMVGLSDSARQTAESLKEFNKATEQLNEAARGLRNEVSRFNVSD